MRRWKSTLVTMFFVSTFVLAWWGEAGAVPFSFQINRFTVTQGTTVLLNDGFDDGLEPPSGPNGSSTYSIRGTFGALDESGGSLTLNDIGAELGTSGGGVPILRKGANLRQRIDQGGGDFYVEADFAGILPADTRAEFGFRENYRIGLSDGFSNDDDNITLQVDNVGGLPEIRFRDRSNGITLGTLLLGGPLSPEITLRLNIVASSGMVTALFDPDGPSGLAPFTSILDNSGSTAFATIFDGETQTRARFRALSPSPIPEPSTLLLLFTGLAGLAAWRRRKAA